MELSTFAAPSSMAACVSWPQACMKPSRSLANSTPLSSLTLSASMSARRKMHLPGLPPTMSPTSPLGSKRR